MSTFREAAPSALASRKVSFSEGRLHADLVVDLPRIEVL